MIALWDWVWEQELGARETGLGFWAGKPLIICNPYFDLYLSAFVAASNQLPCTCVAAAKLAARVAVFWEQEGVGAASMLTWTHRE